MIKMSHSKECRAKNPRACRYHGRVIRLEEAIRNKDLDEAMRLREELDLLEQEEGCELTSQNGVNAPLSNSSSPLALPDYSAFQQAAKDGLIRESGHPDLPLVSYKYLPEIPYLHQWNEVTLNARGIIFNSETGELVSRPFSKFFNYGEQDVPTELLTGPIIVTEKLDGSLGISYETPDGELCIASSNSFRSPQAQHATSIYKEKYEGQWSRDPNLTYMWEVIYPDNRIVVDYGDEDDIYLIGAVDKHTGKSIDVSQVEDWKWKRAQSYSDISSLDQVLGSSNRHNHEGYVVHYTDTDVRVKYKHEEYLNIHRVATGVTSKTIWKQMVTDPEGCQRWKKNVPEEFLGFINEREAKINTAYKDEIHKFMLRHSQQNMI